MYPCPHLTDGQTKALRKQALCSRAPSREARLCFQPCSPGLTPWPGQSLHVSNNPFSQRPLTQPGSRLLPVGPDNGREVACLLLNNRGSAAPFSLARLAWGFARALQSALPTRTSETRGENGGAPCLPAVSGALCGGQDNLANELVKRPLVTRLASPRPIWEIPLKGCRGSCAAPSVATRGGHPATLRPCIKIITRRDRWPSPPGASGPRGRGWGAAEGGLPAPQRPSRPRHEPEAGDRAPQAQRSGRRGSPRAGTPAQPRARAQRGRQASARTLAAGGGGSPCASGPDRNGFPGGVAGQEARRSPLCC